VTVCLRVDNPGADGKKNCVTGSIRLEPGGAGTLAVPLKRFPEGRGAVELFGMRGMPAIADPFNRVDPSNMTQFLIFVPDPEKDHLFEVASIRATGRYRPLPADASGAEGKDFFPFIDTFGQYIHGDWPGKTHSMADLERHREEEAQDLAAHISPAGWNRYGGFDAGPKLAATGFFRTEKQGGRWWLVDPEGRLFWSHGIDCVHPSCGKTPITDRKHWFEDLPEPDSPFQRFLGRDTWAPHGYYKGKAYETYNQSAANLFRKYGPGWKKAFAEITHRRLRSFGMNTIGNWSSEEIYLERKTPYVAAVYFGGPLLEGSEGYWGKFRDVFDPGFEKALEGRLAREIDKTAGDPWCIGYFVDNELSWGDDLSLAVAALGSPPGQPAKKVFIESLRAKYGDIVDLNSAWGTRHSSWEALNESRTTPDRDKAGPDLSAFYARVVEIYFKTCRDAVKEVAPDHLYLGCRFAWANACAVQAAAKYCDVISYNLYRREIASFRLPGGIDKPVIIGEFHFGALDRGMFHTGLQAVEDQDERGGGLCKLRAGSASQSVDRGNALVPVHGPGHHGPGGRRKLPDRLLGCGGYAVQRNHRGLSPDRVRPVRIPAGKKRLNLPAHGTGVSFTQHAVSFAGLSTPPWL